MTSTLIAMPVCCSSAFSIRAVSCLSPPRQQLSRAGVLVDPVVIEVRQIQVAFANAVIDAEPGLRDIERFTLRFGVALLHAWLKPASCPGPI